MREFIYLLLRGFDYEGETVESLHRSEAGAMAAADTAGNCWSDKGWKRSESIIRDPDTIALWECGSQYLRIARMPLQD